MLFLPQTESSSCTCREQFMAIRILLKSAKITESNERANRWLSNWSGSRFILAARKKWD